MRRKMNDEIPTEIDGMPVVDFIPMPGMTNTGVAITREGGVKAWEVYKGETQECLSTIAAGLYVSMLARETNEEKIGCTAQKNDLVLAVIGTIPMELLGKISKVFCKRYPGALCLDGAHPTSKRLGAMTCIIPAPKDSKP
jgi:hypothetical protein